MLALFVASQYGDALHIPFINDDFIFLDKTRAASFASLWEPAGLAFHWYRPWSREFHYWVLQRLFGARELPFHLASLMLALAVLTGYFVVVRRLAGARVAAVATAGWAALAAWAVPMLWVAGVQDLWMLAFAMLVLLAAAAGARWVTAGALVMALLSKETAAILPVVVVAFEVLVNRRRVADALRRSAPLWVVAAAWAFFHPLLGGRLWRPLAIAAESAAPASGWGNAGRTLAMPFNLDQWPAPEGGWLLPLLRGTIGAALLAMMVLFATRPGRRRGASPEPAGMVPFGVAWALIGWIPLLMPGLGWHGYYALFGAAGAWLALGAGLSRRPPIAIVVVAGLALLRSGRADTPSLDWGSESYQRRAAAFIRYMRDDLQRIVPEPPHHSRFYFVRVPSHVGFLAGDGPALRVWYGDSTLSGGYYPAYRPRTAGEPRGPDLFFRYDSTAGWIPVRPGRENVERARLANPRWVTDHEMLAQTLARAGAWPAALIEYLKLSEAESLKVEFAFNAGVCYETLGDSTRAARWYARAASLPGADAEARATARRFAHLLPDSRRARGAR